MNKINKIRKLYELAIAEENKYVLMYTGSSSEMGNINEVALDYLHVATEKVETLKEVLGILEGE